MAGPAAPHRVLRSALAAAEAFEGEVVGIHRTGSRERPLPKMAAQTPSREVTGTVVAMALYAGEGVGEITEVIPAAQCSERTSPRCARAPRALGRHVKT